MTTATSKAGSGRTGELVLAMGVVGVLTVLVVPIPAKLLDVGMVLNWALALTAVLAVSSVRRPTEMSVFPCLLLLMTLGRLSLNIASTRLILMQGTEFEGLVVKGLGQVMVGGSIAIGFVVFLILVAVQYLVISKGSERVAEVTARFHLDAMQMKMMAIQAQVERKQISAIEGEARMEAIQLDADFYGGMDGATRFIKNETIASLLIFATNMAAGVYTGFQSGLGELGSVVKSYALLTVGDGVASMMPSLFLSAATALLVMKQGTDSSVAEETMAQLGRQRGQLALASVGLAVVMGLFGMASGTAAIPLMTIAFLLGIAGFYGRLRANAREEDPGAQLDGSSPIQALADLELRLSVPLFEEMTRARGRLMADLERVRYQLFLEMGVKAPPLAVTADSGLEAGAFAVDMRGQPLAAGRFSSYRASGDASPDALCDRISAFVSEKLRLAADELLGRQQLEELMHEVRGSATAVYEAVGEIDRGTILEVLRGLLAEGVSIRDRVSILEAIAANRSLAEHPQRLIEAVRRGIARQVSGCFRNAQGRVAVMTLTKPIEAELRRAFVEKQDYLALPPARLQMLLRLLTDGCESFEEGGLRPVLLTTPELRRPIKSLIGPFLPTLSVISRQELASGMLPDVVKQLGEKSPPAAMVA